MKGNLLVLLLGLFVSVGYAADVSWKCDWFGIDCPQGDQNQVLFKLLMVETGEASGKLPKTLETISENLECGLL